MVYVHNRSLAHRMESRYDMLCFEGISLMLNIFRKKRSSPEYKLKAPPSGKLQSITATEDVGMKRQASYEKED